jgi:MFS family permease
LGGLVGALGAAKISDRFGARRTVLFFSYWTLIALCLNLFAFGYHVFEIVSSKTHSRLTYFQLMLSRFLVGLATSVNLVVSGAYLTDVAPVSQRGRVNIIGSALQAR